MDESLAPDQAHIWYRLTESLGEPVLAVARALLSSEERSRHDGYRLVRDRRDYAAAHALLRTSLSSYNEVEPQAWAFEAGGDRKPELSVRAGVGVRLTLNLSHARSVGSRLPRIVETSCELLGDGPLVRLEDHIPALRGWPSPRTKLVVNSSAGATRTTDCS